jgi:hypothetical protein
MKERDRTRMGIMKLMMEITRRYASRNETAAGVWVLLFLSEMRLLCQLVVVP